MSKPPDTANDGLYRFYDVPEGRPEGYTREWLEARRLELEALRNESRDLREVDKAERALRELRAGTYGICTGCGKWILERRMEHIPTTGRCMNCKSFATLKAIKRPPSV